MALTALRTSHFHIAHHMGARRIFFSGGGEGRNGEPRPKWTRRGVVLAGGGLRLGAPSPPAKGLGSTVTSPQWGPGWSPGANRFLFNF